MTIRCEACLFKLTPSLLSVGPLVLPSLQVPGQSPHCAAGPSLYSRTVRTVTSTALAVCAAK